MVVLTCQIGRSVGKIGLQFQEVREPWLITADLLNLNTKALAGREVQRLVRYNYGTIKFCENRLRHDRNSS
jgi:hypothetical protein